MGDPVESAAGRPGAGRMNWWILVWAIVAVGVVAYLLPRGREAGDSSPAEEPPVAVSTLNDLGNLAMRERGSDPAAVDRALGHFRQGNALDPRNLRARFGLAWAAQVKGLPQSEWQELYRQTVTDASMLAYLSLYNMAYTEHKAERYRPAIDLLEHALRVMPERPDGWTELGAAQIAIGEHALAVETLKRAAELDARSPRTFRLLGRAHAGLGQEAEAQAAATLALRLAEVSAGGSDPGRSR